MEESFSAGDFHDTTVAPKYSTSTEEPLGSVKISLSASLLMPMVAVAVGAEGIEDGDGGVELIHDYVSRAPLHAHLRK